MAQGLQSRHLFGRDKMGKLEMESDVQQQAKSAQDAPGEDLDQTESSAPNSVFTPATRLYRKRWVMMILLSTLSLLNAYQWIQYSSINNIIAKFYTVGTAAVDWTSMMYMVAYVIFIFPGTWLLEKRGLRVGLLLASMLNCAGAWVKVPSARPDLYWVTLLGQCLSAVAQVFIMGSPPKLAAVWFGQNEVSTGCSIGVLGNQVSRAKRACCAFTFPT